MKLTPSQLKAIDEQKRIIKLVHPDAEFTIWKPAKTDLTRLIAVWRAKNPLGRTISQSQAWTVGKRGKLSDIATAVTR